jgi:hypothetical protein
MQRPLRSATVVGASTSWTEATLPAGAQARDRRLSSTRGRAGTLEIWLRCLDRSGPVRIGLTCLAIRGSSGPPTSGDLAPVGLGRTLLTSKRSAKGNRDDRFGEASG